MNVAYLTKNVNDKKVDHTFKLLKAAGSHIYSKAILLIACGGNDEDDNGPHKDILEGYPKTITPGSA